MFYVLWIPVNAGLPAFESRETHRVLHVLHFTLSVMSFSHMNRTELD